MQKKEARKIYKEKRSTLSEQEKMKLDDLLLIQFQNAEIPFVESLLSYWPIDINNEPNTHLFTEFLRFRNPALTVCYPKTDFTLGSMQAIITEADTPFTKTVMNIFEPGSNDILTPEEIKLVFIPLLAFDTDGFRVGYGKGFYDKWLSNCGPLCIKVGFSYFEPVEPIDDRNEFDVPLDLCITPHNQYVF